MTAAERRWCLAYAFLLIILTTIPIWIAFKAAGGEWSFTGFLLAVEDGNSYIAKMNLGAAGAWLFRSPYTAMPQQGVLAFLPFLLLGKLALGPEKHLQLVLLYQFFRIAAIPLLVLATYNLASLISTSTSVRRWATILGTVGGGLGWILTLTGSGEWLGSLPLDFISPESFGFLAELTLPHLVLARTLMLWALAQYLVEGDQGAGSWKAGILLGLATLIQPLGTLSAFAVVSAHQILLWIRQGRLLRERWRTRWLPALTRFVLPSLPLILYYFAGSLTNPYLRIWSAQNQLPSPHLLHYLLAYGLILPFAVRGAVEAWRKSSSPGLLLSGWVVILPLLAYFPYPVQRRLPEGVWVALSILAMDGLSKWLTARPRLGWIRPVVVGFSVLSSMALVIGSINVAKSPARPAFIPGAEEQAYKWIAENVRQQSVVLASYAVSNALPAWATVRVIIGLGPESANQEVLLPQVRALYDAGMSNTEREAFFEREGIEWLVLGPLEAVLGSWDPTSIETISLRYSGAGYRIYQIGGES